MSDDAQSLMPEVAFPPPISLQQLIPWTILGVAILGVVLFLLGMYQGSPWLHELVHDGRHLLGFPCH